MVLVKDLKDCCAVIKLGVAYLVNPQIIVKVAVNPYLLLSRNIEFSHRTRARGFDIGFYLFVDLADDVLENILIGKSEIDEERQNHHKVSGTQAGEVQVERPVACILVADLKGND